MGALVQALANAPPPSRLSVGPEVLLGAAPPQFPAPPTGPDEPRVSVEVAAFEFDEEEALLARSRRAGADVRMPRRFVRAADWRYSARRPQHAVYSTSNHAYGARAPAQADMPLAWHGAKGEFTKLFGGMPKEGGLRCFTERSKVHRTFDEYSHYR